MATNNAINTATNVFVTSVATSGLATGGPITTTGTITVTGASSAQQVTGTSTTVAVTPGVQNYHPSAAKVWAQWSGGNPPTLNASYNVTSLTRDNTGDITVNLTNNMSSANYAAIASTTYNGTTSPQYACVGTAANLIRVRTFSDTTTIADLSVWCAAFGTLA